MMDLDGEKGVELLVLSSVVMQTRFPPVLFIVTWCLSLVC